MGLVVEVQVGGAGQGTLWRGTWRLLRTHKVVVVMVVMEVQVVVTAGVDSGVPQRQDIASAGWQGRLGRGQVGAGAPQSGGLTWQRGQHDGVAVQQRRGGSLQHKLSALDALILITLRDIQHHKTLFTTHSPEWPQKLLKFPG